MRLVTFHDKYGPRVGVELTEGGDVIDLCASDSSIPRDMRSFLEGGDEVLSLARRICASSDRLVLSRNQVTLKAPISNPDKIICAFNNHRDHCTEQGLPIPKEPQFFHKFATCIVGPGEAIQGGSDTLDFEVELAIVIGRKCRNVQKDDVHNYVAGFTAANDVTDRKWERRNLKQMFLSKGMDTFCPLGPAIITIDEMPISETHDIALRCLVNGNMMQNGRTDKLIFNGEDIISFLSRHYTLLPGDVILCGTPSGVGHYGAHGSKVYLAKGDIIKTEIDKIGTLRNPVA